MNKTIRFFSILFIATMLFTACSPDEYEMGTIDITAEELVEGIAFKIEHDKENSNIIHLRSLMDSKYTPLWIHPQGRSQKSELSLKMPFEGTYTVLFGVQTRGGAVFGEAVTFTIDDFYAEFVNDELWTLISGGVDKEKTWYLDLDEEGLSRYFVGPLYFYGTDDNWETVTNGETLPEGSDSWNWQADWAGNTWMMDAADFGSMTFNLKGGANIIVEHKTIAARETETGTYMLDTDNHTMRLTDATPLHDVNRDGVVIDWGDIKILSLTENTMQLGLMRDAALSGEGACLLVYNFISQEYKENWIPGEEVEPEPTLPDGWQTDISQTVTTSIKWVLSPDNPFDWANLDGSRMNGWNAVEDYPDWTGFDSTIPNSYANFSLTLNSEDNSATYVAPDGTSETGTYTLDDKGFYTFSGVAPNFTICSWVNLSTSSENQWRITNIEKNLSGQVTGMWVGVRDADKAEYMVYHLIPQAGSGSGTPPDDSQVVTFDNSKLVFGDLEGNGKLRLEIYNEYGSTKSNPGLDFANFTFANSVTVKFTLGGISLIDGASGSYEASIYFANSGWWPSGNGDPITVTGNGTYEVTYAPGASTTDALVFVVDITNLAAEITDMNTVTATIDEIRVK